MAKRKLEYKFRYFNAGGRRIAASKLRYAKSFEIWFGSKKILDKTLFPSNKRKQTERWNYLLNKVKRIESAKRKILAERAEKRRKAKALKVRREKAKLKKENEARKLKQVVEEQRRRPPTEISREDQEAFEDAFGYLKNERIDIDNAREEQPQTLENATIEAVTIFPIIPENDTYHKEIIYKIITTAEGQENLNLSILNVSLTPEYQVLMDLSSFTESFKRAFSLMVPHVWDFFNQTKDSSDAYILRIKYAYQRKGETNFTEQGISLVRQGHIRTKAEMANLFIWTMRRFIAQAEDRNTKFKRNYLTGDTVIFITGFTLESTTYEQG